MRRTFLLCCLAAGLAVNTQVCAQDQLTSLVNPFIGTGGHGHTYPGACAPFGLVQLSPDTRLDGWDGCSGYHYSDDVIYGFSHTHLSGTGISDYGDILLMPACGTPELRDYAYRSPFRHDEESAAPGYYTVKFPSGIYAELTATERTGMHRYTFPKAEGNTLVLDLKHRDEVLESWFQLVNDSTIIGYRQSKAWAPDQRLWFALVVNTKIEKLLISNNDGPLKKGKKANGKYLKALLSFGPLTDQQLIVKVALSPVSTDGALANLKAENPGWSFDEIRESTKQKWEAELSKIVVSGASHDQIVNFYSALYHAFIVPNLNNDHNGDYRGRDMKVHSAPDHEYYGTFSLWDTYRATHPLYVLTQTKRTVDFIKTFIAQYEQGGLLPVWELSSNETFCMIGYHAVPVIADAYIKGISGFDAGKALQAMKASALQNHQGLDSYRRQGYIASTDAAESVSRTLEYAYDDWSIAQMAEKMGQKEDYQTYIRRAQYYKNVFDPTTGFMRARINGGWIAPFDPAEVNFNYTEANAWQYSFYVPQDVAGWIELLGGKQKAIDKLDALFEADSKTTGRDQADITGLIGQYAHGNEPSHHMAYLYTFLDQAWKTQKLVRRLQTEMYHNAPEGLCGNEDCGQMSSWFVFSSMGFYPLTPASDIYMIGTPLFEQTDIQLENGKRFTITASGNSVDKPYIQSATLNGKELQRPWITHQEITAGGELHFVMGAQPNHNWGLQKSYGDIPSAIRDERIIPAPYINATKNVFTDFTTVSLGCAEAGITLCYTTDGSVPNHYSNVYQQPFDVKETSLVQVIAYRKDGTASNITSARFSKIEGGRSITIENPYAPAYAAGGDQALIDYIFGQNDFRTGAWQGYEGVDLVARVDLGSVKQFSELSVRFLQDQRSWIFMPQQVDFYTSENGTDYSPAGSIKTKTDPKQNGSIIETFHAKGKKFQARYVRVVAKNAGVCPDWHPGKGYKSWVFADEITIK